MLITSEPGRSRPPAIPLLLDGDTAQMETSDSILRFWFGAEADDALVAERQAGLWWSKREDVDREIRQRFEPCVVAAGERRLDAWLATPSGRLALILLTDQFPRNIYRDTPQAFAFDAIARNWSREGLREGADRALRPIERVFFYLPLEHAESLEDQDWAVALFRRLLGELPETRRKAFGGYLDFAERHRAVIERFGRFPHRNRILGRASTPEESRFLQQKGSSF